MSDTLDASFARMFIERLHAAVNAHDVSAIVALCDEDVVWDDPASATPLRGRDAVAYFHRDVMFRALPDVRIEMIDGPYLAIDGQGIAARTRIQGTMTGVLDPPGFAPTGNRVAFETAEFSCFRDGLLSRHTVILNMLDLARQIGAAPRPGSLGERVGIKLQHLEARRSRRRADR